MTKNTIRIVVGVALLAAAWQMEAESRRLFTKSRPTDPTKAEAPKGDDDFFDRPRPSDLAKTDPYRTYRAEGIRWGKVAKGTGLVGCVLVLLGAVPLALPRFVRVLAWLFIPDFIRKKAVLQTANPSIETPSQQVSSCDTAEQS